MTTWTWTVIIICIALVVLCGLIYRGEKHGPIVTSQEMAVKQAEHPNNSIATSSTTFSIAPASSVAPPASVNQ